MTIESDLFAGLSGLAAGTRVYPDVAPNNPTAPYIVWQVVGGQVVTFLEAAMPGLRNARVQVAAWATTRQAASNLSRAAEQALVTSATLLAQPIGAMVNDFDEDTSLYGSRQDFSLWYA